MLPFKTTVQIPVTNKQTKKVQANLTLHFPCNYIIFKKSQHQLVTLYYLFVG